MVEDHQYNPNDVSACRCVLIEVITVLGKYRDRIAVVGGWVPELTIPGQGHMGSLNVDLALDAARFSPYVYETIRNDLLGAGYTPTDIPNRFEREVPGNPTPVRVDLLCGEYAGESQGSTHEMIQGMAVWKARGLDLAAWFHTKVRVSGTLPDGGRNEVTVTVPTIPAFLCMKGILLVDRKKEKDAYDVYFCVANFPDGLKALSSEFQPMLSNNLVQEGLRNLRAKFSTIEDIGPVWAARVAVEAGAGEEFARRDAFEQVNRLLDILKIPSH
ncbi:MAG: hypothetical protein ISS69_18585 [Phycisphaerae bacterium]|nr:hypothetical protein [Planctomycetota bacterium]MBL7222123.1 hypothetical protein [Phycisphaerae bacterium]